MYNLGLMKLADNNPEEAYSLIGQKFKGSNNALLAKRRIEAKRVTKPASVGAFNSLHFKKAKKLEFKPFKKQFTEPPIKPLKAQESDWDHFLTNVKKFKLQEELKYSSDKKFFDEMLLSINNRPEKVQNLIPGVETMIIEPPDAGRDPEQNIKVTQQKKDPTEGAAVSGDEQGLQEQFIELVSHQSTYCVGEKIDPIIESYKELLDGVRQFDQKFGIETFVQEFLETVAKQNVDLVIELLKRYHQQDELFLRARTFIMSCFDLEDSSKHGMALNNLIQIVAELQEQKLKKEVPSERFVIESGFNNLIQDIQNASRTENGPGPLSQTDQHWVDRLMFHKDLSGRSIDNFLARVLGLTKLELNKYTEAIKVVGRPENFERLDLPVCPRSKKIKFQRSLKKSWKRHIKKPLNFEE